MDIRVGPISQRQNTVWFEIVLSYSANRIENFEIQEMFLAISDSWRNYYNTNIVSNAVGFLGQQGNINLRGGQFFSMSLNRDENEIDDYFRTALDHLQSMSQGHTIPFNVRFLISGNDIFEPQDVLNAELHFKMGYRVNNTDIIYPRSTFRESFGRDESEEEQEDEQEEQRTSDVEEEERVNQEQQQRRRSELLRRIEILENELRTLRDQVNENTNLLVDLRQSRRRFTRDVIEIRRVTEDQNRELNRRISSISRQLRALQRVFNSGVELTNHFDPEADLDDTEILPDLQSPQSAFSIPDSYIDDDANLDVLLNFFNEDEDNGTDYSGDTEVLSDTELYDVREDEELQRQQRIFELREEIRQNQYEINSIDDLLNDLTRRRDRRELSGIIRQARNRRREHQRALQTCQRELRVLERQ